MPTYFVWSISSTIERENRRGLGVAGTLGRRAFVALAVIPRRLLNESLVDFMYYNFGRVHQTLRVTPAMEAGIANHVWSVEEIVALLD